MVKKFRILFFFLIFILLINCSFDNKTGIWNSEKNEKVRVSDIEKQQKSIVGTVKLYSSENNYNKEIKAKNKINLSEAKKNINWSMSGANLQNLLGNFYLDGAEDIFLKKRLEKINFLYQKI